MLRTDDDAEPRVDQQGRLTGTASTSTVRALVAAAADKSGRDITVLDVAPIISIIDCFVLVSAANTRQVRTIVDEVGKAMRDHDGSKPIGVEGLDDASWVLLDFGDVVVHVFLEATRAYYDLDRLWADAACIPFDEPQIAAVEH
jgi:ribosome-associated protein